MTKPKTLEDVIEESIAWMAIPNKDEEARKIAIGVRQFYGERFEELKLVGFSKGTMGSAHNDGIEAAQEAL